MTVYATYVWQKKKHCFIYYVYKFGYKLYLVFDFYEGYYKGPGSCQQVSQL